MHGVATNPNRLRPVREESHSMEQLIHGFQKLHHCPILVRSEPPGGELTLVHWAATSEDAGALLGRLGMQRDQWIAARRVAECPIVAVLGQLNGGKSSVVATFLSEQGRRRVPRGFGDAQGTHRFVYWLPQSWLQDEGKQETLLELLDRAHGTAPDFLPEDAQAAAELYASGYDRPELLGVPLIAGDPKLDNLGFALLDCPDVQTREAGPVSKTRLDFVAAAAGICSAVLFVITYDQLRDRHMAAALERVRRAAYGVPLYVLVNRVVACEDTWHELSQHRELQQLAQSAESIYIAFDQRIPGWLDLFPEQARQRCEAEVGPPAPSGPARDVLPWFVRIERSEFESAFRPLPDGTLLDLMESLQWGKLQQEIEQTRRTQLLDSFRELAHSIDRWVERQRQRTREYAEKVLAFVSELFVSQDRPGREHIMLNPQLFMKYNEALHENAPWYTRPALLAAKTVNRVRQLVDLKRVIKKMVGLKTVEDAAKALYKGTEQVYQDPASGTEILAFHAERVADKLARQHWLPRNVSRDQLDALCKHTIRQLYDVQALFAYDPQRLRQSARAFWAELPLRRKAALATSGLLFPLALFLTTVDCGTTLLIWLGLTSGIGTTIASLPGVWLLVISVGAGYTSHLVTPELQEFVEHDQLRYRAAMYYLFCDALGLPRISSLDQSAGFRLLSERDAYVDNVRCEPFAALDPNLGEWTPTDHFARWRAQVEAVLREGNRVADRATAGRSERVARPDS